MPQLPSSAPTFSINLPWAALLALGLAFLACIAVVTVLLSARRPIIPFQKIKAAVVTLLWIVPALAVVGMIGFRWESRHFDRQLPNVESQSAIREEVRSTLRYDSSEPVSTVVTASVTKTVEMPAGGAAIAAEAEQPAPAEAAVTARPVSISNVEAAANEVAQARREERRRQRDANSLMAPHVDGVLKVVETHAGEPDWAGKEPVPSDKGTLVALSSQRFATLQEAEQQLTALAASYVREFYKDEYPLSGGWTVPVSIIERNAVRKLVGETQEKDFGNGFQSTMYRAHLQLELNSAMRKALHDSWHGQIVSHRLTVLGSMLGLVTLMLATSAGYFRLDDLTGGLYRRRLKFAAASLIAAGSLVAVVVV
jgi:hypothetical protein